MCVGDPGASALPREVFVALCACFRRGLENPRGRIAKLMKKSGFDSPEVLGKIDFDLTPEQYLMSKPHQAAAEKTYLAIGRFIFEFPQVEHNPVLPG
jgi:hypothetical protein